MGNLSERGTSDRGGDAMSTGGFILLAVIALIGAVVVSVALAHYSRKRTMELYGDYGDYGDFDDFDGFDQDDSRTVDSQAVEGHSDQTQ
jgi:hypothetical protein